MRGAFAVDLEYSVMSAYIVIDGMDGAGKGTVIGQVMKVYPPP